MSEDDVLVCALPGCDGTTLRFRVTSEDGERWYCSGEHWEDHVCGLGIPVDAA